MPNIGAFIAWGFITALFIPDGWLPNEGLASIQPYMLTYLLPVLIAYTGGKMVGGVRGGVMGAIAVMGCIAGVGVLVSHSLLPLAAIFVEPAKVLFLINAINHGIFTPIGAEQAVATGKSIMYMLEANPGPGLGVLLAYWMFAKDKNTKQSAPGAIIIHFFGGIHEIYFPYILMNPLVIIAPIVGNICAITFFTITGCGLKAPASPGSIIAFLAMAPKDKIVFIIIGVIIATVVSFVVASPIIKFAGDKVESLEDAKKSVSEMKAASKGLNTESVNVPEVNSSEVKKIIFACDAGMGSSAMGATKFKNRIKDARPDIVVKNSSVDEIPADTDIAVVQVTLADRAKKSAPNAKIITINNFLADPALDDLYEKLILKETAQEATKKVDQEALEENSKGAIIDAKGVKLNQTPVSKEEAIRAAGQLLVEQGCVDPSYVDAMIEREKITTTYMGMGIAIPHGTSAVKETVKKTGIVLVQYPEGVDFGDEKAQLIFGIAGIGDEHLELLANICGVLEDEAVLEKMKNTDDIQWILEKLS